MEASDHKQTEPPAEPIEEQADETLSWKNVSLVGLKAFALSMFRIGKLVIKGFREDHLMVHASALTFATLMALVPLLAITLSMSRGLGAGDEMIERLNEQVAEMPEQFQAFIQDILTQVSTTNFFAIGGIGGLILLIMVVQVLGSIEGAFNRIYGIKTSRNFFRRASNYISTLVVVPILMLASGTLTAVAKPLVAKMGGAAAYAFLLKYSPFFATWFAFSFLYICMPNTRVHKRSAILGGFVGALLWLGWLQFYVAAQPGVSNYNVIYGTLASIPIFLAWLYVSWVIVLLGSEFAFAIQNNATYELERAAPRASARSKVLLALAVVTRVAESLERDTAPFDAHAFAHDREVSIRLVNEILRLLENAGIVAEVSEAEGRYVLLKAPDRLQVDDVIHVIMHDGAQPEELGLDHLREDIRKVLDDIEAGVSSAVKNLTVRDLLDDAPAGA